MRLCATGASGACRSQEACNSRESAPDGAERASAPRGRLRYPPPIRRHRRPQGDPQRPVHEPVTWRRADFLRMPLRDSRGWLGSILLTWGGLALVERVNCPWPQMRRRIRGPAAVQVEVGSEETKRPEGRSKPFISFGNLGACSGLENSKSADRERRLRDIDNASSARHF
jgi:hypothetical protein